MSGAIFSIALLFWILRKQINSTFLFSRHYRGHLEETPSHPGGVSTAYEEKSKDRNRREQAKRLHASSKSTASNRRSCKLMSTIRIFQAHSTVTGPFPQTKLPGNCPPAYSPRTILPRNRLRGNGTVAEGSGPRTTLDTYEFSTTVLTTS